MDSVYDSSLSVPGVQVDVWEERLERAERTGGLKRALFKYVHGHPTHACFMHPVLNGAWRYLDT